MPNKQARQRRITARLPSRQTEKAREHVRYVRLTLTIRGRKEPKAKGSVSELSR
jgi:hypothetical protein